MSPLRAGAARAVLTPPVGYPMGIWGPRQGRSKGVQRDQFARALFLDGGTAETDGSGAIALLTLDVAGITGEVVKLIRNRVERLTGLPAANLLISSTHNHTCPAMITEIPQELGVYAAIFAENASGAVYEAMNKLEPARIGAGSGSLPGWSCNRQYPRRPVDTAVGVIRVDAADGWPLARVVNFACHGVCDGGQYLEWSGDFPGAMSASLEEWEPGSVGIFLQGAAGDIHPFDWWFGNWKSKHLHTHEDTEALGRALASEALKVSEGTSTKRAARLNAAERRIGLPRRKVRWSVAEAEKLHEQLKKELGTYHGETWPEGTTTAIAAMKLPMLYGTGANELRLARNQDLAPVAARLQVLRIGETQVSASPGEMFNELGVEIKTRAGAGAWVASYSEGYIGYISTRKPHEEIADVPLDEIVDQNTYRKYYGTTTSPFAPDAGEILVDACVELMGRV